MCFNSTLYLCMHADIRAFSISAFSVEYPLMGSTITKSPVSNNPSYPLHCRKYQREPVGLLLFVSVIFKENRELTRRPLTHIALKSVAASEAPELARFRRKLTMEECFST